MVDVNNTSGFFPDQDNGVVAIFTLAVVTDVAGKQTQDIAYSKDGGYTFEYYEGNPVIDINSTQFRDPKVRSTFSLDLHRSGLTDHCRSSGMLPQRSGPW